MLPLPPPFPPPPLLFFPRRPVLISISFTLLRLLERHSDRPQSIARRCLEFRETRVRKGRVALQNTTLMLLALAFSGIEGCRRARTSKKKTQNSKPRKKNTLPLLFLLLPIPNSPRSRGTASTLKTARATVSFCCWARAELVPLSLAVFS